MSKSVNIIGGKYGRLSAVSIFSKDAKGRVRIYCICDCGGSAVVLSDNLKRGHTLSCGCIQKERSSAASKTHGQAGANIRTPEYRAWAHMKTRCYNEECDMYYAYGGRGISVCERWLKSFENFILDMGVRPSAKHSLDRINVNGNYEPKNCKWSTPLEQSRNKRNNNWIKYDGKVMVLQDWMNELGLTDKTIRRRLSRGLPIGEKIK